MQLCLALVVVVAVAAPALGDDECAPTAPTAGQRPVHPHDCCKMKALFPTTMKAAVDKCMQKYPMGRPPGPPPSGPPPSGPPPTPTTEMRSEQACRTECLYSEEGLLNTDRKPDKAALTAYLSTDASLAPVMTAALDKCFSSYQADLDSSLECTSGAEELHKCVMREVFITCPASLWSATADCVQLKAKLTKCPNIPFMMGGGPKPPTQ